MKRLCEETKGFIYQRNYFSLIEITNLFQHSACLWIQERDSNGSFTSKYPKKKQAITLENKPQE